MLLILTDVILLLVSVLMVAICALSLYRNGNHLSVHLAVYDFCMQTCTVVLFYVVNYNYTSLVINITS